MNKIKVYQDCTNQFLGEIEVYNKGIIEYSLMYSHPFHEGFYLGQIIIDKKKNDEGRISIQELRNLNLDEEITMNQIYYDTELGTSLVPLRFRRVD